MPFRGKLQCHKCHKEESLMWHHVGQDVHCSACYETTKVVEVEPKLPAPVEKPKPAARKSSKPIRSYKTRQNPNATPKQPTLKGKGRRHIFKKTSPIKLSPAPATFTTTNCVIHKGQYFKVGDVVSVRDIEGDIYYAQIQGLLVDQYCEKSASLTWLLPTKTNSPFAKRGFDPLTYVSGPYDDLPRKLDCMEFVMSAPVDYFRISNAFPIGMPHPQVSGYILDRLKPK